MVDGSAATLLRIWEILSSLSTSAIEYCPDGQEANPHRLAQMFLMSGFAFPGGIGLRYWRDEFHSWDGTAYHPVPGGEIRAQLTRWIAEEFERLYRLALDELDTRDRWRPATRCRDGEVSAAPRWQLVAVEVSPAADPRHQPPGE